MSGRRALVDCAVLSLQDACVLYPCCKGCLCRVDVQPQDTTRCRCSRCGYSCLRSQVDYRYRLSLRVARDTSIFGVTVFGACLNQFFGIHAGGLQKLVENLEGHAEASTRSKLLVKAVEDCFIGRHFIFGLKVTGSESEPWSGAPVVNGSSSKDTMQFIASQMILPPVKGLEGCSVISYYRRLLQKSAEYELGSIDNSETYRPPEMMLLIPHHSPTGSFDNTPLSVSGLLSQMQRSQNQDFTLNPTPPWQKSLGLVTSSAEQEDDCSVQDSGDENSEQTANNKTPHHAEERRVLSTLLSLENSSYASPSFAKYPHLSIEKAVMNIPSPSPPGHKNDQPGSSMSESFSTRQLAQSFLSSSLAWEDFPFSESLTEFLCRENQDLERLCETDSHQNVQNQKETARTDLGSQEKTLSMKSISVCQSNTGSHSQKSLDITNTTAKNNGADRHDVSDQAHKDPAGCVNKRQASNSCSDECNQEDKKAISLIYESNEEEQFEGDVYNCSADLFGCSQMNNISKNVLNTNAETDMTSTEGCPLFNRSDKLRYEKEKNTSLTSDRQNLKSNPCMNRQNCDGLIPQGKQDLIRGKRAAVDIAESDYSHILDCIPFSQSTPIVKAVASSSYRSLESDEFRSQPDSCASHRNLVSKKTARIASSLRKLKSASADQLAQCGRECTEINMVCSKASEIHRQRNILKRRLWKPDKHLLAQQHLSIPRGALNMESRETHICDLSVCDVTVSGFEDNDVIVPPTPAAKTLQSVKLRRSKTDNSCSNVVCTRDGQQANGVDCKRSLLDPTRTRSQTHLAQTGCRVFSPSSKSETADEKSLDGSNGYLLDGNEACDWSRDLFSDSLRF